MIYPNNPPPRKAEEYGAGTRSLIKFQNWYDKEKGKSEATEKIGKKKIDKFVYLDEDFIVQGWVKLLLQQEGKQVGDHPLGACDGNHEEGSELCFPCI